jgi:hypothetical protein
MEQGGGAGPLNGQGFGNWTGFWMHEEFEDPWAHAHPLRRRAQRRGMLICLAAVTALFGLLTLVSLGATPLALTPRVVVRDLPAMAWSPPRWGPSAVSVAAPVTISTAAAAPAALRTPNSTPATAVLGSGRAPVGLPLVTRVPQAISAPASSSAGPTQSAPPSDPAPGPTGLTSSGAPSPTTPAASTPTLPIPTIPTWCVLSVCV